MTKIKKLKNKKNPNSTLRENIRNWIVSFDVSYDNKNLLNFVLNSTNFC